MEEPTLTDHLVALSAAVEQYRSATAKAEQHLAAQIEALWVDSAERRDELHESVTGLSNRLEALHNAVRP